MPETVTVTISRISEAETLAAESGLTLSELIDSLVEEALEDANDYRLAVEALEEFGKDPRTYTMDEVMREFGLLRHTDDDRPISRDSQTGNRMEEWEGFPTGFDHSTAFPAWSPGVT